MKSRCVHAIPRRTCDARHRHAGTDSDQPVSVDTCSMGHRVAEQSAPGHGRAKLVGAAGLGGRGRGPHVWAPDGICQICHVPHRSHRPGHCHHDRHPIACPGPYQRAEMPALRCSCTRAVQLYGCTALHWLYKPNCTTQADAADRTMNHSCLHSPVPFPNTFPSATECNPLSNERPALTFMFTAVS